MNNNTVLLNTGIIVINPPSECNMGWGANIVGVDPASFSIQSQPAPLLTTAMSHGLCLCRSHDPIITFLWSQRGPFLPLLSVEKLVWSTTLHITYTNLLNKDNFFAYPWISLGVRPVTLFVVEKWESLYTALSSLEKGKSKMQGRQMLLCSEVLSLLITVLVFVVIL